jgi:hypothetical protein
VRLVAVSQGRSPGEAAFYYGLRYGTGSEASRLLQLRDIIADVERARRWVLHRSAHSQRVRVYRWSLGARDVLSPGSWGAGLRLRLTSDSVDVVGRPVTLEVLVLFDGLPGGVGWDSKEREWTVAQTERVMQESGRVFGVERLKEDLSDLRWILQGVRP